MEIQIKSYHNIDIPMDVPDKIPFPEIHYTNEAYLYQDILYVPSGKRCNLSFYAPYIYNSPDSSPVSVFKNISHMQCKTLDGIYFYASHKHHRYYSHFTLQCLGALLLANQAGLLSKNLNIIAPTDISFQKESYKLHGLDSLSIVSLDPDILYRFKSLYYTDLPFNITSSKAIPFHKDFIKLFEEALPNLRNENSQRKIYIRRGNTKRRTIINESEIIDYFRAKGFDIIVFDNMPISDQIRIIRESATIVSPHGGSGANLAYKRSSHFKFVELFGNRLVNWHLLLLCNKNCDYSGIRGHASDKSYESSFKIDIPLLENALQVVSCSFRNADILDNLSNNKEGLLNMLPRIYNSHFDGDTFRRYKPKFPVVTYHRTFLNLSNNYEKLYHNRIPQNNLSYNIKRDEICFFIPDIGKYISSIDEKGKIQLSCDPRYFSEIAAIIFL